jgi:beta-glucosidase
MAHLAEKYCLTGDMTVARGELDMLGINYYSRLHIQANPNMALGAYYGPPPGAPRLTVMGWPIEPDGLLESLLRLRARYGHIPVFIAENGYSTRRNDTVGADIDDQPRIDYIAAHLDYAHRALQHGIDLRGFFVWSLMDCFEWNDGYRWRFGMVAVDPATMAREPKKSFAWYSALARAHSAT